MRNKLIKLLGGLVKPSKGQILYVEGGLEFRADIEQKNDLIYALGGVLPNVCEGQHLVKPQVRRNPIIHQNLV